MHQGGAIEIAWSDRKLANSSKTDRAGQKRFGQHRWKLLRRRLAALEGAATLRDLRGVGGFHVLTADLAGSFALALDGPYRLLFRPDHDPVPLFDDGGVNEAAVTRVLIEGVSNYHG
jgi:toxin HigB-1